MKEDDLHGYQKNSVKHIIENPFSGLFLDMGLGKTVSTLTAINKLYWEELEIDKVLIIAPKRVAENVWSSEIKKWEHLQNLKIEIVSGPAKKRIEILNREAQIYTISRDNVAWLCSHYGGLNLPFDMFVIDESSSFKNHASLRFKTLRRVQPSFKRGVILTGTPAPNGLIDLWAQLFLLDRGERLGKTISQFRESFFVVGDRNGHIAYNYIPTESGEHRIKEKIGDICISMKAKDYLDLPERIDNFIKLKMPDELKTQYREFEREKVLELFGLEKEITVVNSAALCNKLLQFANGSVYDEERNSHLVHNLKIDALEEIMESSNGKPVLLAYTYQSDADRIMTSMKKYKPVKLKSGEDIEKWNRGEIPLMILHPASGGHGLNLQAGGNIIVWFGQTWSLELYQQFNARLDRQGQTEKVICHHLILEGSMDEDVLRSLEGKNTKQDGLMDAVKFRIEKYLR